MADYDVPELKDIPVIPAVQEGTMAKSSPFIAKPEHQEPLGFPGELVENWEQVALDKLEDLTHKYRSLKVYLDSCVKCGACTDKCHYFLGTADPKNMPVARQDLLRKVYRRYFTLPGKLFPKLVGAVDLTKDVLDEWYSYYHQCSQCRRCSVFCPYGIDTAEISMAAREILDTVGVGQKYCNEIIAKVYKIGNNLGLPKPALVDTLEDLEEEVEEDTGVAVKYPVDVEGADILVVTPSADFFAEPHIDGLIGYGKVFHQAGINWTLSSHASEAANFGMFIGSYDNMKRVALRIREAALDLGVKRIVVGECGHAWRVAYAFWNTLAGPFDFLDPNYPVPQHIIEVTHDLIQRGALNLDPSANDDHRVTFHDSCNVARATRMGNMPGGQFILPREVIKASVNHFYDMAPETIHENTFCCGGGGGLLTDDLMELRVKGAMPRMQALDELVKEHDVNYLAAICAICKSQFTKTLPYYNFPMDMIGSVHGLVSNAIQLGTKE
ncbi:sulfate reduction electron transfer complex DsrMKJOP subunit DsrK [Sulfuriflexus sp.]|uniref:sulfate reduction electron transfer complex DsrMKJOP subunit DsrK n=1 Tax=Sulfuriflexus sp. TaxID=2015443 RepID=UPI0028CF452D|nr:(Fe-S)-binding protein [Sulfuriflexus sp.]MDT8403993.1 (Fe-S)-binding protein [Sulfuriflexus sp.]